MKNEIETKIDEKENKGKEVLDFDRKCKCDWCGQVEICSITHYGTSHYNRLICLECACSINQNDRAINGGDYYFDLNNSMIRFRDFVYNIEEEAKDIEDEEDIPLF